MVSRLSQRYKFQPTQAPFNSSCTILKYTMPQADLLKSFCVLYPAGIILISQLEDFGHLPLLHMFCIPYIKHYCYRLQNYSIIKAQLAMKKNIITEYTKPVSVWKLSSSGLAYVTSDKSLPLCFFPLQSACCTYVIPWGQGLAFPLYNVIYSWDFSNATVRQNHCNGSEPCSTSHPNPSPCWYF